MRRGVIHGVWVYFGIAWLGVAVIILGLIDSYVDRRKRGPYR